MNYKFRSSMDNSPPIPDFTQNPNSNFSYITHQSIRGFTTTAELRHPEFEFPRNPINVRDSILREFEKERIRARLIEEERILEEEVRREMMFERELACRFLPTMRVNPNRVPLMTNFQRGGFEAVPFQRDPVLAAETANEAALHEIKEVNGVVASPSQGSKNKVIILAKPSANLADIKRKAMAPPVGGIIEVSKKPKTKEDWSCALCKITATSERGLNDHLQGKKHKTKERGMVSQGTGFGSGPIPKSSSPNTCKPVTVIDERENGVSKAQATDKPKKKFRYFCEICQARAYSIKVFNAHKRGKKHLANLSKVSKTVGVIQGEGSAQKSIVDEIKQVEMASGETKEETEVETGRDFVDDSDENRVEDNKVLDPPNSTYQESVWNEGGISDADATRVEESTQKAFVEENKQVEMAPEQTKQGKGS